MFSYLLDGKFKGGFFFQALLITLFLQSIVHAQQNIIPPAGESGIIQKSLENTRPERGRPPTVIPEIKIQDSRKLKDPGTGPSFFVRHIQVEGNRLVKYEELAPIIALDEGLEVTLGILDLIGQEITALYFRKGYILARTYIPAQKIQDGVVTFQVVEGRLGRIEVTGNQRFLASLIRERFKPLLGRPDLKEKDLERPILELNDLIGLRVSSVLRPGKEFGTSDLVIEVKESLPFRFSLDADNFGSVFTGQNRVGITAATGSLFTFGDMFKLRALRTGLGQDFVSPSYMMPLNDNGASLELSYIYSDHQLGGALSVLNAGGSSHLFTTDILQTLYRSRMRTIYVGGGLDFRFFENSIQNIITTSDDLFNVHLFAGLEFRDSLKAQTFVQGRMQFGYTETDATDPLNSRFLGQGNEIITSLSVTRYQSAFFFDSYLTMKFSGQITHERVLSPDQFVLGGVGTVRGYPLADASGDKGYLASVEYVIPLPINIPVTTNPVYTFKDLFSLFAFIDHGRIFIEDPQSGERNTSLTSAGGGIRLSVPKGKGHLPGADFSLTYGLPVLGDQNPSDGSLGIIHIGGRLNF
ncbi:MAG: ShlB/FhaC/HecB family hemolysin secretion/activation protein [Candidatus Nitronauta litoralis]|uniref:ShlB/FhaC/HecB family hemolysin secretion/activation protein n=1 Tax=Candidatus Nitronauta litoralis TaxID=2705533 RepID=A0A7T0BX02_9BACT|nr:MAG: ShlB/FhaC/HecB family hemolysin secretion/activation protein [Candidatus Nitronauta litoralis]